MEECTHVYFSKYMLYFSPFVCHDRISFHASSHTLSHSVLHHCHYFGLHSRCRMLSAFYVVSRVHE
uniref:Uncharacterized protein n=1 Tax=Rhizophora mucronata TaxID=61149 RepID=A0A2P2L239_RHIMU